MDWEKILEWGREHKNIAYRWDLKGRNMGVGKGTGTQRKNGLEEKWECEKGAGNREWMNWKGRERGL